MCPDGTSWSLQDVTGIALSYVVLVGYRCDRGVGLDTEAALVGVQQAFLQDGNKSIWPEGGSPSLLIYSESVSVFVLVLKGPQMVSTRFGSCEHARAQ